MYYRFMFQESRIWEAGNPLDPEGEVYLINARSEEKARRRLPPVPMGRTWILIGKEEK